MVDSMSAEMISIRNEDRFAIGHDNRIVATRKESWSKPLLIGQYHGG
jgi:hypothetical protein